MTGGVGGGILGINAVLIIFPSYLDFSFVFDDLVSGRDIFLDVRISVSLYVFGFSIGFVYDFLWGSNILGGGRWRGGAASYSLLYLISFGIGW